MLFIDYCLIFYFKGEMDKELVIKNFKDVVVNVYFDLEID